MKYFYLLFFIIAVKCNQPKKNIEKPVKTETIKKNKIIPKKIKDTPKIKTQEELIIVLKNAKNIVDAKALIVNSGLIWNKLLIDENTLKAASIKVPLNKKEFWIERLKSSNVFSTVAINSNHVIDTIKEIAKNTFVKVRKTHCSGDCPVFDVTFFKDGKVIFNGIENVPLKGITEFKLTDQQLKKIEKAFSKTAFLDYNSVFVDKAVADYPSTFITHHNKEIEIKLWKNVPEELAMAYESLDGILFQKKLIE